MSALFAATYPERTAALILYGTLRDADARRATTRGRSRRAAQVTRANDRATTGATGRDARDAARRACRRRARSAVVGARFQRLGASPGAATACCRMIIEIDVRDVLPGDPRPDARPPPRGRSVVPVERQPRYLAEHIPGARLRRARRATITCPGSATPTPIARRDRGVPHRARARRRARPRARHRAVHRHRRLDRAAPPSSATRAGASCSSATTQLVRRAARALPRPRGQDAGRRLPRHLRRPGPRRSAARRAIARRRSARSASRCAPACTPASASSSATTSAAWRSTSARGSARCAGADEVLVSQHRQGPRRRLRDRVQRPRRPRAQGRPRRMAALRRGQSGDAGQQQARA